MGVLGGRTALEVLGSLGGPREGRSFIDACMEAIAPDTGLSRSSVDPVSEGGFLGAAPQPHSPGGSLATKGPPRGPGCGG